MLENSNRPDEAVARFREALDLQSRIVASPAARPDYRMELANTETHIGRVLKSVGKLNEAEQALTAGRNILDGLVADYPDVPRYRMELVATLNSLGSLLKDNGKPRDAELVYHRAIEQQEQLVEGYPDVPATTPRSSVRSQETSPSSWPPPDARTRPSRLARTAWTGWKAGRAATRGCQIIGTHWRSTTTIWATFGKVQAEQGAGRNARSVGLSTV